MTNLIEIIIGSRDESGPGLTRAQRGARAVGAAIGTAGVAAGALFTKGLADNMHIEQANDKLAAQLGLTGKQAESAGKVAGKVYADNWGESIDDVNNAIKSVGNNIGDISAMAPKDLQKITEGALALASTFDLDVNDSTRAAGQLMKTGLAKNATEAFDIITSGMQHGLDKSGDFLDTLNEYAPQFAKLGISGKDALSMLSSFLQAGARDTDAAADAFKEFSIRAIDGSVTTVDAYKSLKLNAKATGEEIAKGGPTAKAAMDQVIKALQGVKDPVEQNRIGVELFGTQWEDTVRQILPKLDLTKGAIQGVDGATQKMADTVGDNAQGKIDTLKRGFEQWTQKMAGSQGALGLVTTGALTFGGGAAQAATQIATMAIAMRGLNLTMLTNPYVLVAAAIIALGVAMVILYKKSQTAREIMSSSFQILADQVIGYIQIIVKGLHLYTDGVLRAVEVVLRAFASIPGPTQHAAQAALGHFMDFKKGVDGVFDDVEGTLSSYKSAVDRLPKVVKLQGQISDLQAKIAAAKASLRTVPKSQQAAIRANIAQLEAQVRKAKAQIASVKGKTAYIDIITRRGTGSADHDSTIIGRASGGIIGAASGGARGGQVMVGEYGREIVDLPYGSTVHPNGTTENMLAAGRGGGGPVVLEIHSGGSAMDNLLVEIIRKAVRVKGGNAQAVLGHG